MKRKLLMTMLGMAFVMILMVTVTQVSCAEDSGITATYKNVSSIDPVYLDTLSDDDSIGFVWSPSITAGDTITVNENGVETIYTCDHYYYKGYRDVYGFFDDDGNALADRFRCIDDGYDEITGFNVPFEWVGGVPSKTGIYASYRFLLYDKDAPEGAKPLAKTNPVKVFIKTSGDYGGIRYEPVDDGKAMASVYTDNERSKFKIRRTVKLDNGKTYKVEHIGGLDPDGSAFDDGGSFTGCENLTSVVIPDCIKTVKKYAFMGTGLKKVTIPSSVKKIGDYAFGYMGEVDFFGGELKNLKKVKGFVIYAETGSEGARYAKENGFKCIDPAAERKTRAANAAYAKAKYTPAKVKGAKVIKGSKKITVRWKKVSKATGYQIRYSGNRKFKKGVKTRTVRKYKEKGITISNLKSNKTLYVQVRAYRTAKGKKYYGKWSARKKVKVR